MRRSLTWAAALQRGVPYKWLPSVLLAALFAIPVLAQTPTPPPRPAEPEEYAKFLERDQRATRLQVDRVIATLRLQPGQHVADLGSGSGLFTRPIARAVGPDGVVYAIDVDEGLLRIVDRTSKEQGLTNVQIVRAKEKESAIREPVDLIFICDTLHHLPKPQAEYLKGLRKSVKPGGRVAIIDCARNWPAGHENLRYDPKEADEWMKDAGFTREESYDFIEDNFFYVYRLSDKS
jgi:arsenite methyltransferase